MLSQHNIYGRVSRKLSPISVDTHSIPRLVKRHVVCGAVRARWCLDVRYGHKMEATALLQRWLRDIGTTAGLYANNTKLSSGAIGSPESRLEMEVTFDSMADWEGFLARIPFTQHKEWSQSMQGLVVDGSPKWEVLYEVPIDWGAAPEVSPVQSPATGLVLGVHRASNSDSISVSDGKLGATNSFAASTSQLLVPGVNAGTFADLLTQAAADKHSLPSQSPQQSQSVAPKPVSHTPPSAQTPASDKQLQVPEGGQVIMDWKGDPIIIRPGDKMPRFF